jgi:hypothetical protein
MQSRRPYVALLRLGRYACSSQLAMCPSVGTEHASNLQVQVPLPIHLGLQEVSSHPDPAWACEWRSRCSNKCCSSIPTVNNSYNHRNYVIRVGLNKHNDEFILFTGPALIEILRLFFIIRICKIPKQLSMFYVSCFFLFSLYQTSCSILCILYSTLDSHNVYLLFLLHFPVLCTRHLVLFHAEMRYCYISKETSTLCFELDLSCQFEDRVPELTQCTLLSSQGRGRGGCVSNSILKWADDGKPKTQWRHLFADLTTPDLLPL